MASIQEQAQELLAQLEQEDAAREKAKTYKPIPKQSPYDYAISLARRFNQELLMGLGDEYSAAANATLNRIFRGGDKSWKDRYDEALPRERGLQKEFDQSNPTASLIAGLAGAAAPAAATIGVGMGPAAVKVGQNFGKNVAQKLARPSMRRRVAGGVGAGGAYGGAYGFGTGEGDATNRVINAAMMAPFGAAVGGAVPVAGALGRPALAALKKRQAANKAGVDKRAIDPVQRALQKAVRDSKGEVKEPTQGAIVADMYPSTRATFRESVDRLNRFGDPARKMIDDRADEAGGYVEKSLDDALGPPRGVEEITTELNARIGPARKEAYDRAYNTPIDYDSAKGQDLLRAVQRMPKGVANKTKQIMDLEGVDTTQFFVRLNEAGEPVMHRLPDVRELDYMTRALGDMSKIERNKVGAGGGTTTKGRAVEGLSRDVRGMMRELVPEYAQALEIAAPPIVARQAAELGSKALSTNMTRDVMAKEIAQLKKSNPQLSGMIDQHIGMGMRNQMKEVAERAKDPLAPTPSQSGHIARGAQRDPTAVRAIKDLSSDLNRGKVEMVIGKEKADQMFRNIDEATENILTRDAMSENLTREARKVLDEGDVGDTVTDVTSGGLKGKLKAAHKMFDGRKPNKTAAAVVEAMSKPADRDVLTQILRLGPKSERAMKEAKRLEQTVGGVGLPAMLFAGRSHNRAELEKEKQELEKKRGLGKYADTAKKAGELTDEALLELMRAVQ